MKVDMTPEEIFHSFIDKEKKILHLGGDAKLKELTQASEYTRIEIADIKDFADLPSGFDYVVLSDVLEYVEDPIALIAHVRNLATNTIVYEFKYDDPDWILSDDWRMPWKRLGLEFKLSQNFDYINDVFLGYATLHICHTPYNGENEKVLNAIR